MFVNVNSMSDEILWFQHSMIFGVIKRTDTMILDYRCDFVQCLISMIVNRNIRFTDLRNKLFEVLASDCDQRMWHKRS